MHPIIKELRPLLFDSKLAVRVAMAELIAVVAKIGAYAWWEMFPPSELVSVMGSDNDAVGSIISNMLFSQFVAGKTLDLQVCCILFCTPAEPCLLLWHRMWINGLTLL
jgi:hypothetical protein